MKIKKLKYIHNKNKKVKIKNIFSKLTDKIKEISNIPIPTIHKVISEKQKAKIKKVIKPGDILLTANDKYPQWQIAEKILLNSNWTHTALYVGNSKIIDAQTFKDTGMVEKIDLDDFLDIEHVIILRPKYKNEEQIKKVIEYAENSVGKPYDFDFNIKDDSKLYCSELPYTALKKANFDVSDIKIKKTFLGDIIAPKEFEESKNTKTIYKTKNNFLLNQISHLPFIISAIAQGALVGVILQGLLKSSGLSIATTTAIATYKIVKDIRDLYKQEYSDMPIQENSKDTKHIKK